MTTYQEKVAQEAARLLKRHKLRVAGKKAYATRLANGTNFVRACWLVRNKPRLPSWLADMVGAHQRAWLRERVVYDVRKVAVWWVDVNTLVKDRLLDFDELKTAWPIASEPETRSLFSEHYVIAPEDWIDEGRLP